MKRLSSSASKTQAANARKSKLGPHIRAVTFDVGGTLIRCWPSVGHIYSAVAVQHGARRISPALLNRRFAAAWTALEDFRHTRAEWAALVDATFGQLLRPLTAATLFPTLLERFAEADAWKVFADVIPALESLRARGLKLGVISNWDERLRPLLNKLHLDQYFAAISVSCEVGAPKPSPVIFQSAAKDLGLAPETILHIGDSLRADVEGAKAAGLEALLLKRGKQLVRPGEIRSLRRLH